MMRPRFKRTIALFLTFTMILNINGGQVSVKAASNINSDVINKAAAEAELSQESPEEQVSGTQSEETDLFQEEISGTEMSEESSVETSDTEFTTESEIVTETETTTEESSADEQDKQAGDEKGVAAKILKNMKGRAVRLYGDGQSAVTLPVNDDGTMGAITAGTLYELSSYKQWIALANYSQVNDLSGYRFCYNLIEGSHTLDFTAAGGGKDFTGLGSEAYPFAGEFFSNYAKDNITLRVSKPLFNYLSSAATIYNVRIQTYKTAAGMADYLVADGTGLEPVYTDISIVTGSTDSISNVTSQDGYAGSLFAHVINTGNDTLTISGNSVVINTVVVGKNAGGLIGELKGNVTLKLDGFDYSNTYVNGKTSSSNADCVGGLISYIHGEAGKIAEFTLEAAEVVYTRTVTYSGSNTYCGGFFGHIEYASVNVKCPMTYNGQVAVNSSRLDIYGFDVGTFAGCIEYSVIELHYPIVCNDIKMERAIYAEGYNWENNGAGIFAGVLSGSEIRVADDFQGTDVTDAAILVQNSTTVQNSTDKFNCSNLSSKSNTEYRKYNIAGLLGYARNSNLLFTEEHPCLITSFYTSSGYGNMAGAIGRYDASSGSSKIESLHLDVTKARLIAWEGNTGGIAGHINLSGNGELRLSNCSFNGQIGYAINDADNGMFSTAIAKVTSDSSATGKIVLQNVLCSSTFFHEDNNINIKAYGGVIGYLDADFEIADTSALHTNVENYPTYCYGGLIGILDNTSGRVRKGTITGSDTQAVHVGKCPLSKLNVFGGLIGKVDKKTSVSLAGTIRAKGDSDTATMTNSPSQQTTYFDTAAYYDKETYTGSIVGEADDALIYMEPDTNFVKSGTYTCDEIGNYGGVIRNKDWDGDGKKLIENFEVTGALDTTIDSEEDLLRLAVAMNTEGAFLPEGGSLNTIEAIRTASYSLSEDTYNIKDSGVICLARNDEKGIANCPFQGSFTGKTGKSTIEYEIISYGQPNIGLFPMVEAGSGSSFKNLNLSYSLTYQNMSSKLNNSTKYPKSQCAGGIAAQAKGDITVENVSYTGTIADTSDGGDRNDYMGGIFGTYIAGNGSELSINKLETHMDDFTHCDSNHVMGGVIGFVNLAKVDSTPCSITVGNAADPVKLHGNIIVKLPDSYAAVPESPFIALIDYKSDGNYYDNNGYSKKCTLEIEGLEVQGVSMADERVNPSKQYSEIGGFLGYRWAGVDVNLKSVNVGTTEEASIRVGAGFGGLVHTVIGKMLVDSVAIGSKTEFNTQGGWNVDNSALLVRNGQYLYMDVLDYKLPDEGIKLLNYDKEEFDELVGYNEGGDNDSHGGIVSVGYNDPSNYYLGRNGKTYTSYYGGHMRDNSGQVLKKKSSKTRYYYDLNKLKWVAGDAQNTTLNSADAVMKWHLLHYANKSVRKFFCSGYSDLPGSYTVSGTIDMSHYSIYPTPAANETYTGGGTIKLDAQGIIDGESGTAANNPQPKYPDDSEFQHYRMHAGLFSDVCGLKVENLTLEGTYSKSGSAAGALVEERIYGIEDGYDSNGKIIYNTDIKNEFKNINLKNLWCVSKNEIEYEAPIGLMIADISSGAQVNFDGITMTGYTDADVTASKKAASALIGNVGGEEATYISMNFQNMDIADAAQDKSSTALNSSKKDEALAKASFIYSYEYKENCSGIYIFTYDDYLHGRCLTPSTRKVTLGLELGVNEAEPDYAKEEYFDIDEPVGKMKGSDTGISFDCNNYIPYVYTTTKKIMVNPKTGSLEIGCGTYEDPYIINSTHQVITLYRYLYDEESFKDILEGGQWKVNPVGDDSRLCDKSDDETTGHGKAVVYKYQKDSFPSKEKLSQAYYQITDDIDLSDYPEFTGFGRSDQPFVGVFVGRQKADSAYPIISMSQLSDNASVTDYGWIQYTKGCVVKDLVMEFSQPVQISENGTAGGVIATVLGGETIIDNVTVQGKSAGAACFIPAATSVRIGGYVGVVNAGGVILRNMKEANLSGFSVQPADSSITLTQCYYICGIIGRVFDGYVVYDGAVDTTVPLFKNLSGHYNNSMLEQSRSYDIINGEYLKSADSSKITWDGTKKYEIHDNKQLLVISMALNSGLLNYNADGNELYVGYNKASRQRSGNYNYVDDVSNSSFAAARDTVIKQDNENNADNRMYHSYLSAYFNWADMVTTDGKSKELNPYKSVTTFTLTGSVYDMSEYKNAFRGLGARYFVNENYNRANVFHGNLKGPDSGAVITLEMVADGIQDVSDAALLNNIKLTAWDQEKDITISNITLSGMVYNKSDVGEGFSAVAAEKRAAAVVSTLENAHVTMKNVGLNQMQVYSQKHAGGMCAYITNNAEAAFINCKITGTEASKVHIQGCDAVGGFVGYAAWATLKIDGIEEATYLEVKSNATDTAGKDDGKNAGGLIGTAEYSILTIDGNGTSSADGDALFTMTNVTVESNGNATNVQIGGLVGRAGEAYESSDKEYSVSDIAIQNLIVQNTYSKAYNSWSVTEDSGIIGTGGAIGAAKNLSISNVVVGSINENETTFIENTSTKMPNHSAYGSGGLVGRTITTNGSNLTVKDCKVLGVRKDDGTYTTRIAGYGSTVGGIVGNASDFTGENLEVNGVMIQAARTAGGIISGIEAKTTCNLTNVSVKDVRMKLGGDGSVSRKGFVGGLIGYTSTEDIVNLSGVKVDSLIVDSDYCTDVGGYIGNSNNTDVKISSPDNAVSSCFLSGINVGGVLGKQENSRGWECVDKENCAISITGNKIISCREDLLSSDKSIGSSASAGGYAGNMVSNQQYAYGIMENITIEDNLIASYDKSNLARLGGVGGTAKMEAYFCHVTLNDNYIGVLVPSELGADSDTRMHLLLETPSVGSGGSQGLRDYLHYVTDRDGDGTCEIGASLGSDIDPELFYQYAYLQGTAFGVIESDASLSFAQNKFGIPKLIDTFIFYTDEKYRPVSDVGAAGNAKLKSNSEMYANARKRCAIVQDGRMTETPTPDMSDAYSAMGITYDGSAPYVFGNLESVMSAYLDSSTDRRRAFRLDENFQNGQDISAGDDKLAPGNVYKNTYMKEDGTYYSPFRTSSGTILPMVVYSSAENGSLDQTLQTYINILTNNSGALNSHVNDYRRKSKVDATDSYEYILSVKTYAARYQNNTITIENSKDPSISVTRTRETEKFGVNMYQFAAGDGDELDTDGKGGTFTFVEITYGRQKYNASNTARQEKWTLVIPVYVEKRLKIYSNMKLLQGIEYNTETLKTNGLNVLTDDPDPKSMTLTRGASYSMYMEYIYADYEKFSAITIPKSLCIKTDGDIYFSPGTKMTLIALDEQSKAYYYTVPEGKLQKIDFTDFKDSGGNAYQLQDVKKLRATSEYLDLCYTNYEDDVAVERYVILVDTSEVTESRANGLYEMHVTPVNLKEDALLYSRMDYLEHCYALINEIDGVTYTINKEVNADGNPNTYLESDSQISEDGKATVHLQYDIKASATYWDSDRDADTIYMDVGFYLAVRDNDTILKVPLPDGTAIVLDKENNISIPAVSGQTTVYYYQSLRKATGKDAEVCINKMKENSSGNISFALDFNNTDMTELERYRDKQFYVVAELVVTGDKDMPAGGEMKDSYEMPVGAQMKTDMGFALEVEDMSTLGMNRYSPEESDNGVVPYTASLAFPNSGFTNPESKYYTIVYQIEEKTSQKDSSTGRPEYKPYTGNEVSLYLGTFANSQEAKDAAASGTNSVTSGKGLAAVSYKFNSSEITNGAELTDGIAADADAGDLTERVIKTHCTLVADCDNMNMTNFRVRAYLIVSDELPNLTINGARLQETGSAGSCLRGQLIRIGSWSKLPTDITDSDYKNDFFVFTVAKIKTSM